MSEVSAMLSRYKEVRQRLRYPPNAVPDTGINLKGRQAISPQPIPQPPKTEILAPLPPPLVAPPMPDPPVSDQPIRGATTFSSTLAVTAEEFGLKSQDLRKKTRVKSIALPRQVAIYIGAKQGRSLSWMGRYLSLDHTTILYARQKVSARVQIDLKFASVVQSIEGKLYALTPPAVPPNNEYPMAGGPEQDGSSEPGIPQVD